MNPDQEPPVEPTTKPTPATPAELAAMQADGEVCLLHGMDLSTKARAVYLFSEELQLSVKEAIDLSSAFVRYAEYNLDHWIKEELSSTKVRPDTQALCAWSVWSGGLASLRMTLRAMVETPVDPGLWKSGPGPGSN
jgi:hypothetical protein